MSVFQQLLLDSYRFSFEETYGVDALDMMERSSWRKKLTADAAMTRV